MVEFLAVNQAVVSSNLTHRVQEVIERVTSPIKRIVVSSNLTLSILGEVVQW